MKEGDWSSDGALPICGLLLGCFRRRDVSNLSFMAIK
jgi:hypothetical protein